MDLIFVAKQVGIFSVLFSLHLSRNAQIL